jgi:hypothetical protein
MKRLIVPPLGGRVAAFEQDHMFRAGLWWPVLKLQELDLEGLLLIFVLVAVHPIVVRIIGPPGFNRISARIDQVGVRAMLVVANCVSLTHDLLKIFTKVLADHLAAAPHSMARTDASRLGLREDDTAETVGRLMAEG